MDAIGNWVIDELVDPGSPKIFRCHHKATEGETALVAVLPDALPTREGHRRELEAMKVLAHANIPELLDFGIDPEAQMIWRVYRMEEGDRLSDRMCKGPLDWRDACALFHQVALALEEVHASGLAHRDLHPGRIVVEPEGHAWLTGFDFALTADRLERMAHAPVGVMAYLAPEVIADPGHHGPRADLYALGVVLYEALTGGSAFPAAAWGERADAADRMLEWKTRTAALDPAKKRPEVPDWLCSLVRKATDPDPDRRLPDIEAFIGWLDAAAPAWLSDLQRHTASSAPRRQAAPAPAPVLVTPVLTVPSSRLRPTQIPLPIPVEASNAPRASSEVAQLLTAATAILGVVTGMAFSSLVVLFVELSLRI